MLLTVNNMRKLTRVNPVFYHEKPGRRTSRYDLSTLAKIIFGSVGRPPEWPAGEVPSVSPLALSYYTTGIRACHHNELLISHAGRVRWG
jgi:hypothetical protein